MTNILLNDGRIMSVGSKRDLLEVIEENLSYDLARHISDVLCNQEEMDEYIESIEEINSNLLEENDKLKNTLDEHGNRNLWNNDYFDYLVEIGG